MLLLESSYGNSQLTAFNESSQFCCNINKSRASLAANESHDATCCLQALVSK
jgi:hypothetical protein